jgi:glutamate/tyrosine decarboxylase-like PLP-dependent enzyme
MEPTDKELLQKALIDAERMVINEALHRHFSFNKSTEMLDIAVKELVAIKRKLVMAN